MIFLKGKGGGGKQGLKCCNVEILFREEGGKVGVRMDFEGPDPKSEQTYTYTYTYTLYHLLKKEKKKHASYAFLPPKDAHEIPQMY